MDVVELLKTSVITGIELHGACILLTVMLYISMRKSFSRNSRSEEISLNIVHVGSALMMVSDCAWSTVSSLCVVDDITAYVINLVYFLSSSLAAACWFIFCVRHVENKVWTNKRLFFLCQLPYLIVNILYLLSPWFGFIFYIQDGEYIRGSLFILDPAIKMAYIASSAILSIASGRNKEVDYLRRKDYAFALFGIPVLISGIFQTITGVDFNCLGTALGVVLIYVTGITNPDDENTDAIYSLGNSYDASYIVNMDTGLIRPLREDTMHSKSTPGMDSMDFEEHFSGVLSDILLAEDKKATLEMFKIKNIAQRFEIDSSFNIRYRVKNYSGRTEIHTASFIKAAGDGGKREFLLGINTVSEDSLIYERNEILSHENERLEQINMNIIESVAKIVEARDQGSGEHIVRVKKLTEIIAREMMKEFPELDLNEEKVKLISSASVLHDVGKIVIPDAVLLKPGRLTSEEFEIMKTHSAKGCDILNLFPMGLDDAFFEYALSICRWHHEKYDGKGYPDGLKGDEIPVAAQIVSAADCFDALVSDRPYKKAFAPEKALEMIAGGECGEFSPKIISALEAQRNRLMELARLYR